MLLLLIIPLAGALIISTTMPYTLSSLNITRLKLVALFTSILNLMLSLVLFIFFDHGVNQVRFIEEYHQINSFDLYLGIDGLSIYFVLLTTLIIPILLLSIGNSLKKNIRSFLIMILLLETLFLAIFLMLDTLLSSIIIIIVLIFVLYMWGPKISQGICVLHSSSTACIHGIIGTCAICAAKVPTEQTIAQCTHTWVHFQDPTMVGVACNFGGPGNHIAVPTAETAVHYCSICFAICCNGCYAG